MRPLGIWLRRGPAAWLGLLVLGFGGTTVFSQSEWVVEWDWGARLLAAAVIVLSPIVAAAVAYQHATMVRRGLGTLARGSVRGSLPVLLPAGAVALTTSLAVIVLWVAIGVRTVLAGGIGPTDAWVYAEVLAPLWAAAAVGLLVGSVVDGVLAGPVAGVALVIITALGSLFGRSPFSAVTTYGTLTGLERPPGQAAVVVACCLGMTALALFGAALVWRGTLTRHRSALPLVAAALVALAVVPAATPWHDQVFRASAEPRACVEGVPAVCGPQSRLPLLVPVQRSFHRAYTVLDGTPFVEPSAFTVTRLDQYSSLGSAAPLDFDPAYLRDGAYDNGAVARALVRPHQCEGLFDASAAVPLLDAQDVVLPWLQGVLNSGRRPAQVPPPVLAAFDVIESCTVRTTDLQ